MRDYYGVSECKASLLYATARTEEKVLKRTSKDFISLYIGIPFCSSTCLYCSFVSNSINELSHLTEAYINALKTEMSAVRSIIDQYRYKLQSIYIGGGTPTSVSANELSELLKSVETIFDLRHMEELTLEAGRPDSLNEEKLTVLKNSKATRICINPQTMNDRTLKLIGRNHSSEDTINTFNLARSMGFKNINMDIIAGLPGETTDMFSHTLEELRRLGPESLTVHTMALKRASRLRSEMDSYEFTQGKDVNRMVEEAYTVAKDMGMHPYYLYRQKNILGNLENVGYCKPGFECLYNIQNMEEKQDIIALGAGAVTKTVSADGSNIERVFNVKNVREYISRVDEMIERKRNLLWRKGSS
jgi:oxygen-independent coproporphyrinogen-3 oxidase